MLHQLKQIHPIKRNVAWWQGGQKRYYKIAYYPAIVVSFTKALLGKPKTIHYLGQTMLYDNKATPLSLMYYPHEVKQKILNNADEPPLTVLDIGGNIGQFAITLHNLIPKARIDSFEPNPISYKILSQNTDGLDAIRIYNMGVGPQKKQTLYYTAGKSATGSMLEKNSITAGETSKPIGVDIKMTDNIYRITKRNTYDLIKIDVEGYEFNVITALKGIKTKYLFIEMSGNSRQKDASSSKVLSEIADKFGDYEIISISSADKDSQNFDLLLKF